MDRIVTVLSNKTIGNLVTLLMISLLKTNAFFTSTKRRTIVVLSSLPNQKQLKPTHLGIIEKKQFVYCVSVFTLWPECPRRPRLDHSHNHGIVSCRYFIAVNKTGWKRPSSL